MADRPKGPETWEPSYPEFAAGGDRSVYPAEQTGGTLYTPAPESSHVFGFRLQTGGFVKKFLAPSYDAPAGTDTVLGVAFKPGKPKGAAVHPNTIASEYVYFFPDEAAGRHYFDRMQAAQHPGEIVQEMIKAAVPYKKVVNKP